jgi:hypothetical protein
MLVDFPRLPEVLRDFWGTLPGDLQDQGTAGFEQVMVYVEQIAPLLGPEVHMVQTMERPLSAQSMGAVYAIPTSNETPLNNLLVFASSNGALTARDFGQTKIYDSPQGMGASISVAVAYGHVFIGMATSVESALRLAGAGGDGGLANDPGFRAAMAPHAGTGNLVQYTRTLDSIEYWLWTTQNLAQITRQQYLDAGWTEEEIEEYGMGATEAPEWAQTLSVDMFERAVGDVSLEIGPSDDGFRGRMLLHEPR